LHVVDSLSSWLASGLDWARECNVRNFDHYCTRKQELIAAGGRTGGEWCLMGTEQLGHISPTAKAMHLSFPGLLYIITIHQFQFPPQIPTPLIYSPADSERLLTIPFHSIPSATTTS
jgi:hypothetical protein